jgi:predicted DNA-binding transcriptional regulator AlpA
MREEKIRKSLVFSEVTERTKLKRSKTYELIKVGEFPAPMKYPTAEGQVSTTSTSYWDEQEIEQWLEDRKTERDRNLQLLAAQGLHGIWFPGKHIKSDAKSGGLSNG